jgi:hypothetical protein
MLNDRLSVSRPFESFVFNLDIQDYVLDIIRRNGPKPHNHAPRQTRYTNNVRGRKKQPRRRFAALLKVGVSRSTDRDQRSEMTVESMVFAKLFGADSKRKMQTINNAL